MWLKDVPGGGKAYAWLRDDTPVARVRPKVGTEGWIMRAGLLALASVVSQFDRTVVNLTVEPIKKAFSLDDTHFGLLQGVAFGIFYVLACVPIGRLADRDSRLARLSCVIMLRFAQVYPAYAIHSDQPGRPKDLEPARLQP